MILNTRSSSLLFAVYSTILLRPVSFSITFSFILLFTLFGNKTWVKRLGIFNSQASTSFTSTPAISLVSIFSFIPTPHFTSYSPILHFCVFVYFLPLEVIPSLYFILAPSCFWHSRWSFFFSCVFTNRLFLSSYPYHYSLASPAGVLNGRVIVSFVFHFRISLVLG